MAWMAETEDRRASPLALWPEARTAIVLAQNYGQDLDPLARLEDKGAGVISIYALNRDYHDLVKGKLKRIAQWLKHRTKKEVKVFVDTAPLMEKPLAQKAGLGWQGKHTNLVSRDIGSWFFIGTIFTEAEIEPDAAEEDHCGTCRACLDICPTEAFPAPYQLDARRCISYLTIEHEGHIDAEFRASHGQPHLWLRRLPGRLPVEQVRAGGARGEAGGARRPDSAAACRSAGARRCRRSARCSPPRRSSASGATASSATC